MTSMRRRVLRLLRSPAGPAAALLGGVVCLLGRADSWWLVLGGACVAAGLLGQCLLLAIAYRQRRLSTFWLPLRFSSVLVIAVGCWYAARQPQWVVAVLATALMLCVLWWTRWAPTTSYVPLQTSNLPGSPPESQPRAARWPYGWIAVILCAWLVLGFAVGALAWAAVVLLVLSLLLGAAIVVVDIQAWPLRRANKAMERALSDLAPTIAMPYNGHAIFHVEMWAPYLERTGQPIIVITTDPDSFRRVSSWGRLPAVYAPDGSRHAVRAMLPRSVRAAFYVYNGGNGPFLEVRRIAHVFVHHGDSDKHTSSVQASARYDVLVVAGQAAVDRYAANGVAVEPSKFLRLGRPQIELIDTVTRPIAGVPEPVVLYAPTWRGEQAASRYSSLLFGDRIVDALLARGATVIFRPHPAVRNYPPSARAIKGIRARLAEDTRDTGRAHVFGRAADQHTVAELTNLADAMIADVSGIVTDFMASLKPFAMVAAWTDVETFRAEIPTSLSAYVIAGGLGNLDTVLHDMLGPDPLASMRVERRRYYLGDFEGAEAAEAFVAYASALAAGMSVGAAKNLALARPAQDRSTETPADLDALN